MEVPQDLPYGLVDGTRTDVARSLLPRAAGRTAAVRPDHHLPGSVHADGAAAPADTKPRE